MYLLEVFSLKTFTARKMFRGTFYGIEPKTIRQEIFYNQLYEKTEFEATVHVALKLMKVSVNLLF